MPSAPLSDLDPAHVAVGVQLVRRQVRGRIPRRRPDPTPAPTPPVRTPEQIARSNRRALLVSVVISVLVGAAVVWIASAAAHEQALFEADDTDRALDHSFASAGWLLLLLPVGAGFLATVVSVALYGRRCLGAATRSAAPGRRRSRPASDQSSATGG